MKTEQYQKLIVDKFLEALNQEKLPWTNGVIRSSRPANFNTKNPYKGINWLMLMMNSYKSPFYLTYLQSQENGFQVRKGESSSIISVYKKAYSLNGKSITEESFLNLSSDNRARCTSFPVLRTFNVFNLEQMNGSEDFLAQQAEANERVALLPEIFLESLKNIPTIENVSRDKGGYCSDIDVIVMPFKWQYENINRYYKTLFHEIIHSTGISTRLNRESIVKYDQGQRPYEELVAEIGASFLCDLTGILDDSLLDNSKAYIQDWIEMIGKNPKAIIKAAKEAQMAIDYLVGEYKPDYSTTNNLIEVSREL